MAVSSLHTAASRRGFGDVLAQLGSYTHLPQPSHMPQASKLSVPCSVASLTGHVLTVQLQGLPALQELQLVRPRAQNPVTPAAADPSVPNPAAADPEGGHAAPGGDPLAEVVVDSRVAMDSTSLGVFCSGPYLYGALEEAGCGGVAVAR